MTKTVEQGDFDSSRLLGSAWQAGPRVKVCGVTRLEDALEACRVGVWAIGLVFAPSARQVSVDQAARLVASLRKAVGLARTEALSEGERCYSEPWSSPVVVGVFTEAEADEIVEVAREVGLDAIQLHGKTGPEAQEVRAAFQAREEHGLSGPPRWPLVIRAVPVEPESWTSRELISAVERASPGADMLLFDTSSGGRFGGTGRPFTWEIARQAAGGRRFLVAGGITPDTALEAIVRSGAWGIDVSSGVEIAPGVKDHRLMRQLMQAVRQACHWKEIEEK
ncbi:MAG: phosphoribosylanthranilate isomerase [Thermoleophilia bacterium]|nr:phosphoribosylanthranilate isomerase [Thermoleophilia bacterium]